MSKSNVKEVKAVKLVVLAVNPDGVDIKFTVELSEGYRDDIFSSEESKNVWGENFINRNGREENLYVDVIKG